MTGQHLKVQQMGDNVLGVKLEGSRRKPEPVHFRVTFPGGDVDIVRTTTGDYWVHVRVDHPDHPAFMPDEHMPAMLSNARLDILGNDRPEIGDFAHPDLYHLAVRVTPAKEGVTVDKQAS